MLRVLLWVVFLIALSFVVAGLEDAFGMAGVALSWVVSIFMGIGLYELEKVVK